MTLRETLINVCEALGVEVNCSPTPEVLDSRIKVLKSIIEEIGVVSFSERYIQLLKDDKISFLEPNHLFCGSKELEAAFDSEFDTMSLQFLKDHPEIDFDKTEELWKIPYHIEYNEPLPTIYWDVYNSFCINFYEPNLLKLTSEELIVGLKRCHSYGEWGLNDEDIAKLKN